MNLATAFADSAARHASKPALFWGDECFSFEQINHQADRLAAHLRRSSRIEPGERVALWLRNRPEFVASLFGVLKAGAVVVPINNFLKPEEVLYILKDAGVRLMVTEADRREDLDRLHAGSSLLRTWLVEEFDTLPEVGPSGRFEGREPHDLAVIVYTSGTTGHPKGAMLTHGNLLSNVESCRQVLAAVEADRFVVLLPMFHSFMLCVGILLPMLVGGSIVLIRSLHPPKNVLQEIIRHQATILPAIPQFFRALTSGLVPPSLPIRVCVSGAAPLPVEVLREFNRKMTIPLIEGYGLSEASPVVSMNPLNGTRKEGSIGLPIPGVEVSIRGEDGTSMAQGKVGELCVRGGNVMLGYWNRPEETAAALRDGWLYTGDVGYQDEDGYLFITDRKKDMLLVNGINVYPREIEEILYTYPGIREAAVIGVADSRRGEHPVAFAAAEEGLALDEKTILAFLREKLADYKVPKHIHFLPSLPRNATGKILKTALRQLARS